ncbi:unnamed protein product [Rotaria sp. Silwood2]|nr:unnamed protein product [Rotaria sp. Silwood2]
MLDYVRQRPSPTISLSSLSFIFIRLLVIFFMFFNLFSFCLHDIDRKPIDKHSLQTIFKLRNTQIISQQEKKFLRIIYFREFDMNLNANRLKFDVKNLTESYGIDFKINIIDQSKSFSLTKLCSIISEERRDTILIADLYTKEIDLISRSLKLPTIAITNRYQIVQGKLHNPYLFKLMPDAIEDAKTVAYTIDTRSVYTRIAIIYDTSLDMVEFRLSYLRLAKQIIVYRAQLPRISLSNEFRRTARTIINDLTQIDIDLILCMMSTERETQFVRLIKEFGSLSIIQLLLNRTSWWFASRLDETHNFNYLPKIFTASEDRRRTLSNFSSTSMKILLNAVLKTYIRLSNLSTTSSLLIGPTACDSQLNVHHLKKTHMFIQLFTNFTEWSCDIRIGSGVDPILFEPKTLAWRVPTMFMVHTEHECQGMLTRTFYTSNTNADQFFRSCSTNSSLRKSSSSHHDNSTSNLSTTVSNALVDITSFHRMGGKLWNSLTGECRFVHIYDRSSIPIIVVGVVEPPYIFVSDAQISSEFHCNYGIPCYQIDPPLTNMSINPFIFNSKTLSPPHCVFVQPFSCTPWCMIFLVLNAASLFETFFEWHSPYGLTPKGRKRQKVFSLASALTLTWSIVFSHTFKTKSPKCWSNRFLGNVWGGFGIVFIAIYTAKLAAFMVEVAETQTASNVQGLIDDCRKMSQCSIGVVANTSDEEYIKKFFTSTLYTHMQHVSSYAHGIESLRKRSITYLLMDHSMARYYLTREVFKSIRISGDNFGAFGLSLGFSKFDTDLKHNITNILLSYVDKGIIQRLHDDWYVYENCEMKRLNENRELSIDRFIGVFILLGAGMIIGFITLLLEWITFKYAIPYWRKRQWPGWMFCSQRLYTTLNASDEVYSEAYRSSKFRSSRCVGERLHNYSTRSDSLDLRVVDVPKLLCTTYQLKEQMNKINEQQQIPLLPPNGNLRCTTIKKEHDEEQKLILKRIDELEEELTQLKLQLSILDNI